MFPLKVGFSSVRALWINSSPIHDRYPRVLGSPGRHLRRNRLVDVRFPCSPLRGPRHRVQEDLAARRSVRVSCSRPFYGGEANHEPASPNMALGCFILVTLVLLTRTLHAVCQPERTHLGSRLVCTVPRHRLALRHHEHGTFDKNETPISRLSSPYFPPIACATCTTFWHVLPTNNSPTTVCRRQPARNRQLWFSSDRFGNPGMGPLSKSAFILRDEPSIVGTFETHASSRGGLYLLPAPYVSLLPARSMGNRGRLFPLPLFAPPGAAIPSRNASKPPL